MKKIKKHKFNYNLLFHFKTTCKKNKKKTKRDYLFSNDKRRKVATGSHKSKNQTLNGKLILISE